MNLELPCFKPESCQEVLVFPPNGTRLLSIRHGVPNPLVRERDSSGPSPDFLHAERSDGLSQGPSFESAESYFSSRSSRRVTSNSIVEAFLCRRGLAVRGSLRDGTCARCSEQSYFQKELHTELSSLPPGSGVQTKPWTEVIV